MNYDLKERTARFGEDIIDFIRTVDRNEINHPLLSQIIRSATSVGANYMEANQAASKKDLCEKLWSEAHQLTLIFAKISSGCEIKNSKI